MPQFALKWRKTRIFAFTCQKLFKQKNNKKHVEIHIVGSACVGDTFCSDWESGGPFCRDLGFFLGPTVLAGSYMYI